jgi:hypothetical protein
MVQLVTIWSTYNPLVEESNIIIILEALRTIYNECYIYFKNTKTVDLVIMLASKMVSNLWKGCSITMKEYSNHGKHR